MRKVIIKPIIFLGCVFVLTAICGHFLLPVRTTWNHYHTMNDFYEEPDNSIETLFLGSSMVVNGINPIQLYQEYGLCSYNLGTEQQPIPASYYWIKEAYRKHSETLTTVVLDGSMLRRSVGTAFYRIALDRMKPSSVKMEAVSAYSNSFQEFVSYYFSIPAYHDRWNQLSRADWAGSRIQNGTRGYNFREDACIDYQNYTQISIREPYDSSVQEEYEFDELSLEYFDKIVQFCKEHDLQCVLIKTPDLTWNGMQYNAAKRLAESHDVAYLDFNYDETFMIKDFQVPLNMMDRTHMNYSGASKITHEIGNYLIHNCRVHDVRKESAYAYMEDQIKTYEENVGKKLTLHQEEKLLDYLKTVSEYDDCVVLISVRDEASTALQNEDIKTSIASMGFELLPSLQFRDSYLGIIDDGKVICERLQKAPEVDEEDKVEKVFEPVTIESKTQKFFLYSMDRDSTEPTADAVPLMLEAVLPDKTACTMISGGYYSGNTASIRIDNTEYSLNKRGVNIVVYDYKQQEVIASDVFDTCKSDSREILTDEDYIQANQQGMTWKEAEGQLRAYVYLPISASPGFIRVVAKIRKRLGKRAGKTFAVAIPLIVVWILTGLWHGTGWNYLVWGAYWGLLIILGNVLEPELKRLSKMLRIDTECAGFRFWQQCRVFLLFLIGRLISMPSSLAVTGYAFSSVLKNFGPWKLFDGSLLKMGLNIHQFIVVAIAIGVLGFVSSKQEQGIHIRQWIAKRPIVIRWIIYLTTIFAVIIFGAYGPGYDASSFVYMVY